MTEHQIKPDDPRLTAYALGELEADEAAIVAAAVEQDPALAREVEAIRTMGGELEAVLQSEELPEVEPVELSEPGGERIEFPLGRRSQKRFPYYWISGLAAAGFAVLIVTQSPESPLVGHEELAQEQKPLRITVVEKGAPAPAVVEAAEVVAESDMTVGLNRFEAAAGDDVGYAAASTLADTRLPETKNELLNSVTIMDSPESADSAALGKQMEFNSFAVPNDGSVGYASTAAQPAPGLRMNLRESEMEQRRRQMVRKSALRRTDELAVEGYAAIEEHGWKQVVDAPFSTFGVDVDSASYANVRRCLRDGHQPSLDAVKIEEMINAFTYDYAGPAAGEDTPLQANLEVASAPWAPQHRLVRIGLKAREMAVAERAPANLVLLLDVSGSMDHERKLPLVKEAMRLLLGQLREDDRVAIVTYAGNSGLALPSTPVAQRREITAALDALQPGGSTHGSSGIHLAYDVAKANFVEGGVNRVILCTDGDFNVGTTGLGELERLIAEKAESGVYLTGLGFGTGNYQDDTLATLANHGNGAHGYIDSVREARRLLVEQVTGTLATVAQDVKIQVEFNPAQVAAYRLLGYNDRRLAPEEFNDDTVDAGEIGAGHTVTALYEVVPVGVEVPDNSAGVDALRYQDNASAPAAAHAHELLLVKVRAQPPGGGESRLHQFPLVDAGHGFAEASPDFKFAAAVAAFGLQLRGMPTVQQIAWTEVKDWARSGIVTDPGGYRREFLELVDQATRLSAP